jgi:hypothetical protein
MLKLRTFGATRPLPHTPSWHTQGHLYLYRSKYYDYIIIVVIVIIIIITVIIVTTTITLMKPDNTEQTVNPYSKNTDFKFFINIVAQRYIVLFKKN